jgi:hypothetical protein
MSRYFGINPKKLYAFFSKANENSDKIKLINRDFSGINILEDRSNYTEKILVNRPFDGEPDFIVTEGETKFYRINSEFEYSLGQKIPLKNFLSRDHAWIEFSFDYKISRISNENLINGAGNRAIINGDLGAEFDNKGYYVLYAHYKLGVNMTSSSVPVQLNRFEIGMSIKAKDLF